MASRHVAQSDGRDDPAVAEERLRQHLVGVGPAFVARPATDVSVEGAWVNPVRRQVIVEYRGLHVVLDPVRGPSRPTGVDPVHPADPFNPSDPYSPPGVEQASRPPVFDERPSAALATWVEDLELADASGDETLGLLRATQRLIGWATARQVDAVVEVAARRLQSAEHELRASQEGADQLRVRLASRELDMAERAVVDEIALELSCTRWLADRLVTTALALAREFPATLDALRAGRLDPRKAETIACGLLELSDPVLRRRAETLALKVAPELNVPTLRERIKQAVLRVQPEEAAEAAADARRRRRVVFRPAPDDMMELWALLPADDGARVRACLDRAADRARHPGDERTADQRRLDTIVDAVTGPRPAADDPAPDDPAPDDPAPDDPAPDDPAPDDPAPDDPAPDDPAPDDPAPDDPAPDDPAAANGGAGPAEAPAADSASTSRGSRPWSGPKHLVVLTVPFETVAGDADEPGCLSGYGPVSADLARRMARDVAADGTWRCAVVDGEHGTLLGLGASTFTPSYAASAALGRHVLTRDQVCRFPGCRARAVRCDIDHRVPYPGGPSCECNAAALCAHHHRVKHETAFRVRECEDPAEPPGTLIWTTPGGREYLDRPASLGPATPPGPETPPGSAAPPDPIPF